ncbi:unnamed protein product, partial [Polarella glacialis]
VGARDDYHKIVHDVYTTQYLQALGVDPTCNAYRKAVARNSPLEKCEIEATWIGHSSVAGHLRIVQPPVGRGLAVGGGSASDASFLRSSGQAERAANKVIEDFHGTARYISAVPPDVFEPSNLPKQ